MKKITKHYATVVTMEHTIRVTTWEEDGEWFYSMHVDGKKIDEGKMDMEDDEGPEAA